MEYIIIVMAFSFLLSSLYNIVKKQYLIKKQQTVIENKFKEHIAETFKNLSNVQLFLENSVFYNPIANWNNAIIYQYVFNDGYLYEFNSTLSQMNEKTSITEDLLYFNQLSYKRVNDPQLFIKKYINIV